MFPINCPYFPLFYFCYICYAGAVSILQVDGVSGRKTTYSELQSKLFRVASALWRLGIRKGDVVTLFSENSPEFLVMFLSLAAAGAVVSAVNPVYTPGQCQSECICLFARCDVLLLSSLSLAPLLPPVRDPHSPPPYPAKYLFTLYYCTLLLIFF